MTSPSISHTASQITSQAALRPAQDRLARNSQLSVGLGLIIAVTFSGLLWMAGLASVHSLLA
jgi:hypothetical protein